MAYSVDKLSTIDLGRQGENLARTVEIDVSSLLAQWPDAIISLLCKRKHDTVPYVAVTEVKDGMLIWPITSVETESAGDGKIELRAVCGEVIAKSMTAVIRVTASLTGSETEAPDAAQGWVDQVLAAGSGVEANAIRAEEAAAYAEEAVATIDATVEQAQEASRLAGQEAAAAEASAEEARQVAEDLSAEIERIDLAVADVEEAENKFDSMTVSAETLEAGAPATVTVSDDGTTKCLSFGIPKGEKGDKPVRGEDYWTENDKQEVVTEAVTETMEQVRSISFYICSAEEVDENGVPTIASPDDSTFYLVSSGESEPNLFIEWVYLNEKWERFGSATVDMSGYVKSTDYASVTKAGVVEIDPYYGVKMQEHKISISPAEASQVTEKLLKYKPITPALIDLAVKVGLTTNTIALTEEEQAVARTWLNAVGKTDYAQTDAAGVAQVNPAYGIGFWTDGKSLKIVPASSNEIAAKISVTKPITPSMLDEAAKVALTTNTLTLTEEEQAAARAWLHVLGKEDYATATTPGVAKVGAGLRISSGGALTISGATDEQINGKKAVAPITPTNLDRAVKVGLTTNTIALTEAEQTAAQAWLGGRMIKTIGADENGEYVLHLNQNTPQGMYLLTTGCKIVGETNTYTVPNIGFGVVGDYYSNGTIGMFGMVYVSTGRPTLFNVNSIGIASTVDILNADLINVSQTIIGIKTFSAQPVMTAELAADDDSTNIPTTQWVNAAIQNALTALDATEVAY